MGIISSGFGKEFLVYRKYHCCLRPASVGATEVVFRCGEVSIFMLHITNLERNVKSVSSKSFHP